MRRRTQGKFISSLRVGITTLTEALGEAELRSDGELGTKFGIDKSLTTLLKFRKSMAWQAENENLANEFKDIRRIISNPNPSCH
jgi:hypothetical protein